MSERYGYRLPTDLEVEQRAENERLRAECFSLAAHQCHAPGYGDESGNHRCKYQDDIEDLRAENAKLCDRWFAMGAMNEPPCFACGYNGPGYFQPEQHACAARHHRAVKS